MFTHFGNPKTENQEEERTEKAMELKTLARGGVVVAVVVEVVEGTKSKNNGNSNSKFCVPWPQQHEFDVCFAFYY